jgi:hypothetical protein
MSRAYDSLRAVFDEASYIREDINLEDVRELMKEVHEFYDREDKLRPLCRQLMLANMLADFTFSRDELFDLLGGIIVVGRLSGRIKPPMADPEGPPDDFEGCKYKRGQHVIPHDVLKGANSEFATVWQIEGVSKNYGGPGKHYYHCTAPGFGTRNIWEKDIVVTDEPVSHFP